MRNFLTYLMLFGVLAGLGVRAFGNPNHVDEVPVCQNCVEHASDHDCDGADTSSNEKHCPDCPAEPHEHHHVGSCCIAGALIAGDFGSIKLALLDKSHILVSGSEDILPDSPVLSEDKPPLI